MNNATDGLRNFLTIPYDELERLNTEAREKRLAKYSPEKFEKEYVAYLNKEKRIKAVTLCFSDIEGKFHMLDYDKKFFISSYKYLTFDGSSVKGYSTLDKSDLFLAVDWSSFRWLPSDVFGPGKIILFATILAQDGSPFSTDFRGRLVELSRELGKKDTTVHVANEIEGFLVEGRDAEQSYDESKGFSLVTMGGYYHSLPQDKLRQFIDRAAEAQRAMGFVNEKDHPEVAPAQFEMNYSYTEMVDAADQIQLYKLTCRQIAALMDCTATFLPKPVVGINGSGMHTNLSISKKGKNIFFAKNGKYGISDYAHDFISRILNHAPELCLALNSSVNAYRRLDPHFEAPNQIKASDTDRGSMIRIPLGNERSARIEIRSVGPDANPYLLMYSIVKTGIEGTPMTQDKDKRDRVRFLSGTLQDALRIFKTSEFMKKIMGEQAHKSFIERKQAVANRSPRELGTTIKRSEVIFNHEITNQQLWNSF